MTDFSLSAQDWADFSPIFVGAIPAGDYSSEIVHVQTNDDEQSPFVGVFYRFQGEGGTYDMTVRYYSDSRWWRKFRRDMSAYGFKTIDELVGLREIVTIAEPANGGRYMEITDRRRNDPAKSPSRIEHKRIGVKYQTASSDPQRRKKLYTDDDLADLDEEEDDVDDEDFFTEDED